MQFWLKSALCFLLLVNGYISHAATITKTLYINRGNFTTVNNTTFPYLAFNNSPVFNAQNSVVNITTNDLLILKIINNDSVSHGFSVKNYGINNIINPGDFIIDTLTFNNEGVYIYYDHSNYPNNRYMGLGGMICVSNAATKNFYWNIKEHQTSFNTAISNDNPVNWSNYYPDYHTINGKSFPDLQNDTTARVMGNVGDTIRIFMVNTGQSAHSIHFHGFHCKVIFSTNSKQLNWVKDTFPLKSMEGMILEMVPDKVGEYSVHDHNLSAVSGGGIHPNGMFMIMQIQ